jgi:hypothetical protein
VPAGDERSLLDAIAAGELDDELVALAAAVEARRRLLLTVRSAAALATLCVGDVVRITEQVSPRYLVGMHGTIVALDDHAATVLLVQPVGRFATGRVRCPPLTLEKLSPSRDVRPSHARPDPELESALAGRDAHSLGDRLDARGNAQSLGLFGIVAGELGEL